MGREWNEYTGPGETLIVVPDPSEAVTLGDRVTLKIQPEADSKQ